MATSDYYVQDNADIESAKLNAAKGLYQSGDYKSALRLYLDILSTSTSFKIYYEVGRCYYKLEDYANAKTFFLRSIELEKEGNPSHIFLGNIFYKENNISKAIEYWTTAYSFKPNDESVCLNLATSYFSKNMKFYSIYFYEKYLQYAKDKTSEHYHEIKKSVSEFEKIGNDFYQKAQRAVSAKDYQTAIKGLQYAIDNFPTNFDMNHLLGKMYYKEQDYAQATLYLKQAFCLDTKSIDILQILSSAMINNGDITGAYCCLKRILPLVINNQKEYLEIIQTTKKLEENFDRENITKHLILAERYYNDNNYRMSLFEYENILIINPELVSIYRPIIDKLKNFINPESNIIKQCMEKGGLYYSTGDFQKSNKFFTKVMALSRTTSAEYKFAKSRLVNNV